MLTPYRDEQTNKGIKGYKFNISKLDMDFRAAGREGAKIYEDQTKAVYALFPLELNTKQGQLERKRGMIGLKLYKTTSLCDLYENYRQPFCGLDPNEFRAVYWNIINHMIQGYTEQELKSPVGYTSNNRQKFGILGLQQHMTNINKWCEDHKVYGCYQVNRVIFINNKPYDMDVYEIYIRREDKPILKLATNGKMYRFSDGATVNTQAQAISILNTLTRKN